MYIRKLCHWVKNMDVLGLKNKIYTNSIAVMTKENVSNVKTSKKKYKDIMKGFLVNNVPDEKLVVLHKEQLKKDLFYEKPEKCKKI